MDFIIENRELIIEAGIILLSVFGGGSAVALKLLPILQSARTINDLLIKNIEVHHPKRNAKIKLDIEANAIIKDVQKDLGSRVIELT